MRAGAVYLLVAVALMAVSFLKDRQKTQDALKATFKIFYIVLPVLIFVFVLMGIIQVYIPKEAIASVLGQKAGPLGVFISEIMGSVALFLPPAVFPFGGYLLQSGASYGAIAGFVFTAILIGVTTLPLEIKLLGVRFTAARNIFTFVIAFFISLLMEVILA